MEPSRDVQADEINHGRLQSDHAGTAPTRARWQVRAAVAATIAICVGLGLYVTHGRDSSHPSFDAYHAYVDHRWYLQLPTSSAGYLELGKAGGFRVNDTGVEYFGTYAITGKGRLSIRWTGVSSGGGLGDQTVVNAFAPLVGDFSQTIVNKRNKTAVITSTSGARLSLDVEGHVLTFAEQPGDGDTVVVHP
jgi:hypothetical protein